MKIGDKIAVDLMIEGVKSPQPMVGVVVHIHPQRWHYTVEFTGPAPYYRKFRESFQFQYRRGNGE